MTARERLNQFFSSSPIYAKKSLGQNFLISDQAIEKMIKKLISTQCQNIVEIGPGPGALTDIILELKLNYQAIELDKEFANYWLEKNVTIHNQDALQFDWTPITALEKCVLISNLPYQISSSIVIDRSTDEKLLSYMILMFQKEVAQKIRASSGSSDFSLLSLIAQTFWTIETLHDLGPRDFLPAPKVSSRVLFFRSKPNGIKDKKKYLGFCKSAFRQKRKLLKSNLLPYTQLSEEALVSIFQELGLKATARAEELSVETFVNLYHKLGFI
ncbi:MAG: 16S rRNA (adenine(1518)-N(6)/adenine(1519)-N(6))-dimethyltransferase RsmA [Bdellovibrionaceae bacterium]|nr:16S rRNA (adenine(1518)-N(6)/adenine(1519)-N(6))-dimethyltransferase RsmA [Pseudobdellovibrionaceae bacterium]